MSVKNTNKLNTFQQVRELPKKAALAFSAALLERMLVNYQLFCELNNFGDPQVAKNVINLVWEYVKAPKAKINCAVQGEKVEEITPDIADFDNYGVYPALDFCMGLQAALQLISDDEPSAAVMVAKLSQGGTESYIAEITEEELSGAALKQHELMQFEIGVQQFLLSACSERPLPLDDIRAFLDEDLVSNIGLQLQG